MTDHDINRTGLVDTLFVLCKGLQNMNGLADHICIYGRDHFSKVAMGTCEA